METIENEELYDLSDEELEAAFKEAKSSLGNEIVEVEQEEIEEVQDELDDDTEDEIEEDLEQPEDTDSDDDASLDAEDETETEEDSENEEGELDGEPESEEEQPETEEDKSEEDKQPVQPEKFKYKANGQEFEFTDSEIKEKFGQVFGQAMNYTQKMQAIKEDRKTLDAIKTAGLSDSDINLAIDVLKGNKDAIAAVLKRTGVDTLDLDTESEKIYVPQEYGRNEQELALKDVVDTISADPEYDRTKKVLTQLWDERSWNEMTSNPEDIVKLHTDVKNNVFDHVNSVAQKLKVYDNGRKSDIDYYKDAAIQLSKEQMEVERTQSQASQRALELEAIRKAEKAEADKVQAAKAQAAVRTKTKVESTKRKAATTTKKSGASKANIDYLNDSDEAFEDWYKNLQDRM